jgi:hypothetical protein
MEEKKIEDIIGEVGENPCGYSPILFVYVFLEELEEVRGRGKNFFVFGTNWEVKNVFGFLKITSLYFHTYFLCFI